MRAHYFQHVPFEGLGSIEPWLAAAGYEITSTRFFQPAEIPDIRQIDLLIVMGGPMSVNDEGQFPWLVPEKQAVREMIGTGKPVLGICLGAQLIASAMGASVYPNPVKEIGWFPVQGVASDHETCFRFPPSMEVFHWHGETFDLPEGAIRLAESRECRNQAFQIGRSVMGLQFHLETTPDSARKIVTHCRDELVAAPTVQTETQILEARPEQYQTINRMMKQVLAFLTS